MAKKLIRIVPPQEMYFDNISDVKKKITQINLPPGPIVDPWHLLEVQQEIHFECKKRKLDFRKKRSDGISKIGLNFLEPELFERLNKFPFSNN